MASTDNSTGGNPTIQAINGQNIQDFQTQVMRLMREQWPNPQMLAEELFVILNQLQVTDIGLPAGAANKDGDQIADLGPPNADGSQNIDFTTPDGKPAGALQITKNGPQLINPDGKPQKPGTSTFPGQVQSGSGSSYQVTVYPDGLNGPDGSPAAGETVSVTQLQIDSGSTIPSGTWALVTQTSDGSYWMQVAVWL